jgi:RNA polymerase sigma-70 factor (ECF subfamily)
VQAAVAEGCNLPAQHPSWAGVSHVSAEQESALVAQAKLGNLSAFSDLIRLCERGAFSMALRMLRNEEDAEDAWQESMLKTFLHLDRFEGRSRFSTWIMRITMNEALMTLRRRRSHQQVSLEELVDAKDPRILAWRSHTAEEHPEQNYGRLELHDILSGEIANLKPQAQAVLILCAVEQRPIFEVAKMLKISASAVKSRFRRARLELRQRLGDRFRAHLQPGSARTAPSGASIPGGDLSWKGSRE